MKRDNDPDETAGRAMYRAAADSLAHAQMSIARRTVRMARRYRVTAIMQGQRTNLVVSDGADPYTTTERIIAERVMAEVSKLAPAYTDPRIEEVQQ